ncbi:MAG: phasin family protein [Alphaproteobacteria bacterium]
MMQPQDFQTFGKEAMDSAVKSSTAFFKSVQAIAAEMADFSKKSMEDGAATFEKLAAVKSVDKAVEVQTEFAKASYEATVARVTKIGELYADLAKEAMKPYEGFMQKMAPAK